MSEGELRATLSQKIKVPNDMPMAELQELYVTIVEGKSMDSLDSELLLQVKYPIYMANALDAGNKVFNFVSTFVFQDSC